MNLKLTAIILTILFLFTLIIISTAISADKYKPISYFKLYWEKNKFYFEYKFNPLIANSKPAEWSSKQQKILIDSVITDLAIDLTSNASSDFERVFLLHGYVYNLNYTQTPRLQLSAETLYIKSGDCADKAILLSSLLSSLPIKNYVAETKPVDFCTHSFNLVQIEDIWFPVDATRSFFDLPDYEIREVYNPKEIRII